MKQRLVLLFLGSLYLQAGTPPINMFNPWDILMFQPLVKLPEFQLTVGYERFINGCGMQADDDEKCQDWRKCCGILQLYQDRQDAIAAFKGNNVFSEQGQSTLLFPRDDDNGTHGLFTPYAKLVIDNIMLSARYAFYNGVTFGLYMPIIRAQLKDVAWKQQFIPEPFEYQTSPNLIRQIEELGKMSLGGWTRHGLGDLGALFTWDRFFPQNKPWLRNVHGGLRGGLLFPTGLKRNEDLLFAFPFGSDGGLSVLGGATLELWWGRFMRFCLDGEFTQTFGTCKSRRIKTDAAQTDLFFITKVPTNNEVGFMQHYTIYLEAARVWRGLSFRAAYQYTKHNDDILFLGTDHFDPVLANTSESLFEWTMHNLILMAKYETYMGHSDPSYFPTITIFYKHGFNGKRSVLGNTVGIQLSMNF